MADWELRPAEDADVEQIAELRAVTLRPDLERLGRFDPDRVRQRLRDGFVAEHTWVIEVEGELAGCIALRPDVDAQWLEHFYIDPRLPSPRLPWTSSCCARRADQASYTNAPPTYVAAARVSWIASAGPANGSRSSTARSASMPGAMRPVSSRWFT